MVIEENLKAGFIKMSAENYMRRCFELAKQGQSNVAPNPMVGAVIVHNDRIIGEGYHQKYGEAHAEVNAINSVKNKELLKESTIYVSLEPCAHHGKTPPCADLIVNNQIPKVVVACVDSFSEVAGKGIEHLKKSGCEVVLGVLEKESLDLNRRFFTFHQQKRPYIILKWAETSDGFIDAIRTNNSPAAPNWITGSYEKQLVHKWRSEEAAILIATNTAEKDNPALTTREWFGKSPLRILIDRQLRLDSKLTVFDNSVPTLILNAIKTEIIGNNRYLKLGFDEDKIHFISTLIKVLYEQEVQSVIIEGGSEFLTSVIESNLWDEARVFRGFKTFGNGIKAPSITQTANDVFTLPNSNLFIYKHKK